MCCFQNVQSNNLALPSDRAGQVTGSSAHHPVASLLDGELVFKVAMLCRQRSIVARLSALSGIVLGDG